MKLESVHAFPVRVPMREKLLAGTFRYEDYQTVIVRVSLSGVVGWGEAMTRFSPLSNAHMVTWVGSQLEGTDFETPDEAWDRIWPLLKARGHTRGVAVEALSGVEIALWDAVGKMKRSPVGKLLGQRRVESVPAYAGSVFESRGSLSDQVERVRAGGLAGFKLKIGFGVAKDLALVRKARRMWDDCLLVPDANGAYDERSARRIMDGLVESRPEWLEEPVPANDFAAYAALGKGRKVPIGAGEAWFPADLQLAAGARFLDVLETSVSRCGGIRVQFSSAETAKRSGIAFAPMIGANSSVSLAASLQVASVCDPICMEYDLFGNPLVEQLTPGFPVLKRGRVQVPDGPGLGIEPEEGFLRRHAATS